MKCSASLFLACGCLVLMTGCANLQDAITGFYAKSYQFGRLTVSELPCGADCTVLLLRGRNVDSGTAINYTVQETLGDEVRIKVHMVLARKGLTGVLNEAVFLQNRVKAVIIGSDQQTIWQRPSVGKG